MIRPEVKALFKRWQEALIGVAVAGLGLYWALFTPGGILHWIGYGVAVFGAILTASGLQRGRFAAGAGGPGVVHVTERRVQYLGPLDGGFVDLDTLEALSLDQGARPPHWVLHAGPDQPALAIPLNAEGADQLFDAFATLPGLRTEAMLREMKSGATAPVLIWRAERVKTRYQSLH